MAGPFLYSVNPLIKFEIQRDYFGHKHYVWCADCYDSRQMFLHPGENLPASSNPAEIFASVRAATLERVDWHNKDIRDWRQSIKDRAVLEAAAGNISSDDEQEIVYLIDHADARNWRPLLYIINREAVKGRLEEVPLPERASSAVEYRVPDLLPSEFDIVGS